MIQMLCDVGLLEYAGVKSMWYTHNLASVEKEEKIALKCDQQQLQGKRNREKLFSLAFFYISSSLFLDYPTFLTFFQMKKY